MLNRVVKPVYVALKLRPINIPTDNAQHMEFTVSGLSFLVSIRRFYKNITPVQFAYYKFGEF